MTGSASFSNWFANRLNKISRAYNGEPSAIFFLGLSRLQTSLLIASGHASSALASASGQDGSVDLSALAGSKRATIGELLMSDGPVFLLYEQLKDIKGSLNEMYDGSIVIVRNNLFEPTEGYPSAARIDQLKHESSALIGEEDSKKGDCSGCYADVIQMGDEYLVRHIPVHEDLDCIEINLCRETHFTLGSEPGASPIAVPSAAYLTYRMQLCMGNAGRPSFALAKSEQDRSRVLPWLLDACGIAYSAGTEDAQKTASATAEAEYDGKRLLPLLKKHWGERAKFRQINFYKDPDVSNEMHLVSQGAIADFVTHQAEEALKGSDTYHNAFMTAPTGAGKSLLFQLPALYLAQKHHVVTLVIEPLKQLMIDQVHNLRRQGVTCVAAINSDISYQERLEEYERIRTGETSIIYLSPELLLASSIDAILNGRTLGLVVIDEVHTVTSWGIDFRPDYWYLGSFLTKLRRQGMRFPTFCLTATAVYGGKDDVVSQSISTLELENCKIYLGNPRRDDIGFNISVRSKADFPGPIEEVKTELVCKWIQQSVAANDHAIVYCPYRSHVDSIIEALPNMGAKVMGFHAGMQSDYKAIVSNAFKNGSCRALVSTKAFGMGIDINDINAIYHYAPTGNLADYIQEIGRGARKNDLRATAGIDYFQQDTRYARQLYAMSRFAQWQLREMMGKLYSLYAARPVKSRSMNMLVSPNSFSYLFSDSKDETEMTNRAKGALMMIAQDLEERYNFPVIVVQPKPSYAKQFVCIDSSHEQEMVGKYGAYLKKLSNARAHLENRAGQNVTRVSDMGAIYLLDMARMWEERFPNQTFVQFKRNLFTGELEGEGGRPFLSPRLSLTINYNGDFEHASELFETYMDALTRTLSALQRAGQFTSSQFRKALVDELGEDAPVPKNVDTLLKALVLPQGSNEHVVKCLFKTVHASNPNQPTYTVKGKYLVSIESKARRALNSLKPSKGSSARLFLNPKALGDRYEVAELLQILDLAAYEIRGGDEPEIFVRLNDPHRVQALANDKHYSNNVLRKLNDRHDYASQVISSFFRTPMEDVDRWDLIEEYFLGNDDYVAQALHIGDDSQEPAEKKVKFRGEKKLSLGLTTRIEPETPMDPRPPFRIWKNLAPECANSRELADLDTLKGLTRGSNYAMPIDHPTLTVESTGAELHPMLAWKDQRVLLFSMARAGDFEAAQKTDWRSYLLGQGKGIEQLAEDIRTEI